MRPSGLGALCTPRRTAQHLARQSLHAHALTAQAAKTLAAARLGQCHTHQAPHEVEDEARQYARWLFAEARSRHAGPADVARSLHNMVERVASGEPLAYVIGRSLAYAGHQPFGPVSVRIRPPVLIPRAETEEWALRVASQIKPLLATCGPPIRILDLCTGSGCIALLLAHELRHAKRPWHITAVDYDGHAVALARENAAQLALPVEVLRADMFDDAACARLGSYDWVVCNPPYIREDDYPALPNSVRAFEAREALVGCANGDGLNYYRRLVALVQRGLLRSTATTPALVMEVGAGQSSDVCALFGDAVTDVWHDFAGHDRVVTVTQRTSPRAAVST